MGGLIKYMIRPEVIRHAEESMKKNAELLRLLASEEVSDKKILQRQQNNLSNL